MCIAVMSGHADWTLSMPEHAAYIKYIFMALRPTWDLNVVPWHNLWLICSTVSKGKQLCYIALGCQEGAREARRTLHLVLLVMVQQS